MTGKKQPSAPQKGESSKTMFAPVPGPPGYLGPSTIAAGPSLTRARQMLASKHNDYSASGKGIVRVKWKADHESL